MRWPRRSLEWEAGRHRDLGTRQYHYRMIARAMRWALKYLKG